MAFASITFHSKNVFVWVTTQKKGIGPYAKNNFRFPRSHKFSLNGKVLSIH